MTGRELIVYILQNNLENEPMFADGKPIAHITIWEAAVKANVGTATEYERIMNNRNEKKEDKEENISSQ